MTFPISNFLLIKTFLIGICFGSFFNVVIYRLPLSLSIVKPRSFCPKCKYSITWRENIPLFSWLIQKGKCINCGTNISFTYPLIELLSGLFFIVFSFSSQQIHSSIDNQSFRNLFSWIFFSIVFLISLIDIKHFWIPQSLINCGFIFGCLNFFIINVILRINIFSDLFSYFITIIISFLIFEFIRKIAKFLFKKEALGQGDSKFIAMMSLWLGPIGIVLSVGISYIFAAIIILVGLQMKIIKKGELIPFAPFLSFGALIVWFFGNDFIIKSIYGF